MALDRIAAASGRRARRRGRNASAATSTRNPRAIAYLRVSTDEQAESRAGLDAQETELTRLIGAKGWTDVGWMADEGWSAATLDRPALTEALAMLETGQADALMVAKLDRLSRSVHDFAGLVAKAEREGWSLVIGDLGLDMSTPQGSLMASVLAAFAEFERRLIGERTRVGMAAKRAQGVHLGRPVELDLGVRQDIAAMRDLGWTWAEIATRLNDRGIRSARGRRWHPSTVRGAIVGWGSSAYAKPQNETTLSDETGG